MASAKADAAGAARRASARRSSWSPTASSSATRRAGGRSGGPAARAALEILGEDQVGVERRDEALDLLGHVRLREPPQVDSMSASPSSSCSSSSST